MCSDVFTNYLHIYKDMYFNIVCLHNTIAKNTTMLY